MELAEVVPAEDFSFDRGCFSAQSRVVRACALAYRPVLPTDPTIDFKRPVSGVGIWAACFSVLRARPDQTERRTGRSTGRGTCAPAQHLPPRYVQPHSHLVRRANVAPTGGGIIERRADGRWFR
jgi:hypothetical protein